jgi:putative FmdB family regulatory protein
MPIYEYQCTNQSCRRLYDQLESITAPTTQTCVDCGSLAQRVFGVPAKGKISKDPSSDHKSENYSIPISSQHPTQISFTEEGIKVTEVTCPTCIDNLNRIVEAVKKAD